MVNLLQKLILAGLLAIGLTILTLLPTKVRVEPTPMNNTYFLYIEREDVDWSQVTPDWKLEATK